MMESIGKLAAALIEALKAQPLVLAIVVVILAFLIYMHFTNESARKHELDLLAYNSNGISKLLSGCTPAN